MAEMEVGWAPEAQKLLSPKQSLWPIYTYGLDGHTTFVAPCRGCGAPLNDDDVFADLGSAPLANALLTKHQLNEPEIHFPLRALVCRECLLVQLPAHAVASALFPASYPFYASQSATWLAHCSKFAREAANRFGLGPTSRVLDIGSNDGAMLRPFRGLGIPAVGVEPCADVARHALMEGFATIIDWWNDRTADRILETGGYSTAKGGWKADLITATNVLAHVPDLEGFLRAASRVLHTSGSLVVEVPYIRHLIQDSRWDQIYHEHHSYFSLFSISQALERAGLTPYDVGYTSTHGGSIRVYACHAGAYALNGAVWEAACDEEQARGLHNIDTYLRFAERPGIDKAQFWSHFCKHQGLIGYGASAKAVTLLNYYGVGPDQISAVADITPAKWNKYMPGSHIPILPPNQALKDAPTNWVLNFCWNWREESEGNIRKVNPQASIFYTDHGAPCR